MIAIVGHPGAGKTYTINKLKKLGYSVLIADDFFKEQYSYGNEGYKIIESKLGAEFVNNGGVIIKKLRKFSIINMDKLEELVHPLLEKHLKKQKYDFVEIPIINTKHAKLLPFFDIIINIIRPEKERKAVLLKRNVDKSFYDAIILRNKENNKIKTVDIESGNIKKILEFKIKLDK